VAYWRYDNPAKTDNQPLVLAIEGGPAMSHEYMLPLRQLACRDHSEVIFYDPAGVAASNIPNDTDYSCLANLDYYSIEE
jgi:hypothetical protein